MNTINYNEIKFDRDNILENLFIEVVNSKTNEDILKYVPHRNIKDLSIIYKSLTNIADDKITAILINNDLLATLNITEDELDKLAMENSPRLMPIREMNNIDDILGKHSDLELYVVTNNQAVFGASVIFYPGVMAEYANILGDYYIIPSSIHEVLLLPDTMMDVAKIDELIDIVIDVNNNYVDPNEILSDIVYHYQQDGNLFETVDEYKRRKEK